MTCENTVTFILRGFGAGLAITAGLALVLSLYMAHFVMHCTACLGSLTPLFVMIGFGTLLWWCSRES